MPQPAEHATEYSTSHSRIMASLRTLLYLIFLHDFSCESISETTMYFSFPSLIFCGKPTWICFFFFLPTLGSLCGLHGFLGSGACSRGRAAGRLTEGLPLRLTFSHGPQSPHWTHKVSPQREGHSETQQHVVKNKQISNQILRVCMRLMLPWLLHLIIFYFYIRSDYMHWRQLLCR